MDSGLCIYGSALRVILSSSCPFPVLYLSVQAGDISGGMNFLKPHQSPVSFIGVQAINKSALHTSFLDNYISVPGFC